MHDRQHGDLMMAPGDTMTPEEPAAPGGETHTVGDAMDLMAPAQ